MRRLFRRAGNRGPRVVDANGSAVTVEGDDDLARTATVERVAVLAHWSPSPLVSRSVTTMVAALAEAGYRVVVVSTSEVRAPLDWRGGRPTGLTVLRRPNVGYDFGSWATAFDRYPVIADAGRVLLLNDSMVGPFATIEPLLAKFHASLADVWAVTDTSQFEYHLQSYVLGFPGATLREPPMQAFWRDICVEASKRDVIWRYEIGLSRLLRRERFGSDVAIPFRHLVRDGRNPTITGWQRLLDHGFPFVKRELLVRPQVAPDGELVPAVLRRRFDVDVAEWA
jgi:lipopolysaccharide biosynthesis protein